LPLVVIRCAIYTSLADLHSPVPEGAREHLDSPDQAVQIRASTARD